MVNMTFEECPNQFDRLTKKVSMTHKNHEGRVPLAPTSSGMPRKAVSRAHTFSLFPGWWGPLFSPLWKPGFCFLSYFSFIHHNPFGVLHKLLFSESSCLCSAACFQSWGAGGRRQRQKPHSMESWVEQLSLHCGSQEAERKGGTRDRLVITFKGIAPSDVPSPSRYCGW